LLTGIVFARFVQPARQAKAITTPTPIRFAIIEPTLLCSRWIPNSGGVP